MNKRIAILFTAFLFVIFFLISTYSANAGSPPAKTFNYIRSQKEELLCEQIQDKIQNNQEIRKVIKTSIQMGFNACGVIQCAVKGGGDLKQVIEGAIEAGSTTDMVSRCALDSCTEAKDNASLTRCLSAQPQDPARLQKERLLCGEIQDKIKNNKEIRKGVKTSIQMGFDACGVIRCAIKGGGEVSQIVAGAIDAGSPADIASKCLFDTCTKDIAAILNTVLVPGICYVFPEEPEIIIPPSGGTNGGFLSPSGF